MSILSKEQIRGLIKERNMKTTEDVSAMLRDLFGEAIQEIMEAELDTTLGYAKNEPSSKNGSNRRNGHSQKTVVSEYGDTEIQFPVTATASTNPSL